ncbi:MAG: hypothetical protein K0R54_1114 [Clostridiaceae bacterium]|jgi:hypothetical protein|nr:hypothetical protein [Clostridiaceae bacterium]
MLIKLLYIIGLVLLILGSVFLTRITIKKFNINRWVIAVIAPFVIIIPLLIFKNINTIVWNILLLVFSVMCIMFFEMTRIKLEKKEIKGIIYNIKK